MASIIKKTRIEVREADPSQRQERRRSPHTDAGDCEASLELVRDRGQVVALQVTCSCGERTLVQFEYDEPTPTTQPPSEEA